MTNEQREIALSQLSRSAQKELIKVLKDLIEETDKEYFEFVEGDKSGCWGGFDEYDRNDIDVRGQLSGQLDAYKKLIKLIEV